MHHDLQVELLEELMCQLDEGKTVDTGVQCRQQVSAYIDTDLARREWQAFFQQHPQLIGMSGDLPEPNSFLAINDFGIPVLATRDASGRFRAFLNACRHRGVQLTSESRGKSARFSCPFHAWQYNSDGRLAAVPQPGQFGDIDKACLGLVELPAAEQYGFLWVHPQPGGSINPQHLLGEMAGEIESGEFHRYVFRSDKTIDKQLNWKLANDTFGETYHFKKLHNSTLAQVFYGDNLSYRTFGRNHRFVFARKSIDLLREKPQAEWRLTDGAALIYYLFPNVQLIIGSGRATLVRIYPDPTNPGRSISRVNSYFTPEMLHMLDAAQVDSSRQMVTPENIYQSGRVIGAAITPEAIIEVFNSTIEDEDYLMGESQQRSAQSGLLDHVIFGRNEAALQHYHNSFRSALDLPPLEIVD